MSSPLAPYIPSPERPWNRRRAAHLLRRTGFGAPVAAIEDALAKGPGPTVDALIDACVAQAPIPKPTWAETGGPFPGWTSAQVAAEQAQRAVWTTEFRASLAQHVLTTGLLGRLTLFWHSHYATEYTDYFLRPQFAYRYIDLIQRHALGDFKALTHDMGLNAAMLLYLNGSQNTRTAPNENYARELLELHTLGEGNGYTQRDITELARAFTGYTVDIPNLKVTYVNARFDNWYKTVFGLWENFNYAMAHDHLFQAKRDLIARYVCGRLYTHFVHATPDEAVVGAMAEIFLQNNWRVEPVLRALFKSAHFYDDSLIGAMIPSPYVLLGSFLHHLNVPITTSVAASVFNQSRTLGQELLQPPNVAGWPGHRAWLDTSLLPTRWSSLQSVLTAYGKPLYDMASAMPERHDPYALAAAMAERLLAVPLSTEETIALGDILLAGMPAYEWDLGGFGGFSRLTGLVTHLISLPEFQLH
jgi:uncharacterized protein (DUF1800 family)